MEYPGDCLSDTEALEGAVLFPQLFSFSRYLRPTQDDAAEETNDAWASPPSPPPEDRLPKRSKLDDLVESESNIIKPITRPSNQFRPIHDYRGPTLHNESMARQVEIMDQARLARLERTKVETAAIIAAAAAAQKAEEQRALLEAAAAAEAQIKEEERVAERERRRKERKEREAAGGQRRGGEDNREKRLLKLVGAVVVKTMSKYRARMDVDTFKKHAKEVRHPRR